MFGICDISLVPVRKEPNHRSEQVSELLFGETFEILDEKKEWVQIITAYDEYSGWINHRQFAELKGKDFKKEESSFLSCSYELVQPANSEKRMIPILLGSTLHDFDGINFRINKEKFTCAGRVTHPNLERSPDFLRKTALMYLHAPYRWGGRSPFGIDCSGFVQLVFKLLNIKLKRDASQQAGQGEFVTFINEARIGDLAFFGSENEKITHVGIVLEEGKIIHASGRVKIDELDQNGIFSKTDGKYTHKLRFLRRVL